MSPHPALGPGRARATSSTGVTWRLGGEVKVEGLLENKDEMVLYFQIHGVLPAVQRGCGAKGCQHSDSSERVYFPTIFFRILQSIDNG